MAQSNPLDMAKPSPKDYRAKQKAPNGAKCCLFFKLYFGSNVIL